MSRKAFLKKYDGKLTEVVNIYYVDKEDRENPTIQTGLVLELDDGRFLTHSQDGFATPFQEVIEEQPNEPR